MKTEHWTPGIYECWMHKRGFAHVKGCKRKGCLRRDPNDAPSYFSVDCAATLPPNVRARLIRCVPGKRR